MVIQKNRQNKILRYYNKPLYGGTNNFSPSCLKELNDKEHILNTEPWISNTTRNTKRKTKQIDDRYIDMANVLTQLNNPSRKLTSIDNNEAANMLADFAKINDVNTKERVSYLQNLKFNSRTTLNIALLIEALKNDVVYKNQIEQKQQELYNYLKEIPLKDKQRRDILFKYMFEYLTRTIPLAKLKKADKIAKGIHESIKRAKIHNRHTEQPTESEAKEAEENINDAISRGQRLAQDENKNMKDTHSPIATSGETPWWEKGGTVKSLIRLHSEPVVGHMIEVYCPSGPHGIHGRWNLGHVVSKKIYRMSHTESPSLELSWHLKNQIRTQVDYTDGTSVDELLQRGAFTPYNAIPHVDDKKTPKYWKYANK